MERGREEKRGRGRVIFFSKFRHVDTGTGSACATRKWGWIALAVEGPTYEKSKITFNTEIVTMRSMTISSSILSILSNGSWLLSSNSSLTNVVGLQFEEGNSYQAVRFAGLAGKEMVKKWF